MAHATTPAATPTCQRPAAGSAVTQPAELFSHAGLLSVTLDYVTSLDGDSRTLFCFLTPDGRESPTLHVRPGDTLKIVLKNKLPKLPPGAARDVMAVASNVCGAATMDATSVNLHFHGTNTQPTCHSDGVIDTLINSGQTFTYRVVFPRDEPAGLYWYHPHVHGLSDAALQGGASGAIVVDGIENVQPAVAGLPVRLLVIRDQSVHGFQPPDARQPAMSRALPFFSSAVPSSAVPSWDVSLNYVPIAYPARVPAVIRLPARHKEFWRVLNASGDTIIDLQLIYDGVAQPFEVVALDGVCTGSQDGTRRGKTVTMTHLLLPPAGRVEVIVTGPAVKVARATLQTLAIQSGPDGDNNTARTLAVLKVTGKVPGAAADAADAAVTEDTADEEALRPLPAASAAAGPQRFEGLDRAAVTATRRLYFSEVPLTNAPEGPTNFFITVDGARPTLFSPANPPAITTTEGAVEDWTIENRSQEVHEFHIHQIHFQWLQQNGKPVPAGQQQFRDTLQVPYWTGSGPYPSVTVRMDFRGTITGDFVYHCHILDHEDNGMMAIIRVLPKRDG